MVVGCSFFKAALFLLGNPFRFSRKVHMRSAQQSIILDFILRSSRAHTKEFSSGKTAQFLSTFEIENFYFYFLRIGSRKKSTYICTRILKFFILKEICFIAKIG